MARPQPTPAVVAEEEEVITPLQKILVGTTLITFILGPIFSFALYLLPFYKAEGALYRGAFYLLGFLGAILLSAFISWFWMARLPGVIEKRQAKRSERALKEKEQKREDAKKAREDAAAAMRDASEEE
jgi:hypothetical protein